MTTFRNKRQEDGKDNDPTPEIRPFDSPETGHNHKMLKWAKRQTVISFLALLVAVIILYFTWRLVANDTQDVVPLPTEDVETVIDDDEGTAD